MTTQPPKPTRRRLGGLAIVAVLVGCSQAASDAEPDGPIVPGMSQADGGADGSPTDASDAGGAEDAGSPGDTGDDGRAADASPDDADVWVEEPPQCDPLPAPGTYRVNGVGGGGTPARESDHFRAFGPGDAAAALNLLEAAHKCFVEDWCWRSAGLSITRNKTVYNKFNLYGVESLNNAAGVMGYDAQEGIAFVQVVRGSLADPRVTVHEYGHALTLSGADSGGWVDQGRTGAWWETVANWVADTFITSPFCEAARSGAGLTAGDSMIDVDKVVGNSHMLLVSTQNYYEAWPFFTYLTHNPDRYSGLGRMVLPNLFTSHARNNETPLHVLERLAAPVSVQEILGRYWARMAYVDIGHPKAQDRFLARRSSLNQGNVALVQDGVWRVRQGREPQYGGASIVPLRGSGAIRVQVTNLGNGRPESGLTATLAIRHRTSGSVRYVALPGGSGETTVAANEEASLVVVNTPTTLYQYDAFQAGAPETTGLNWQVTITGGVTP